MKISSFSLQPGSISSSSWEWWWSSGCKSSAFKLSQILNTFKYTKEGKIDKKLFWSMIEDVFWGL